MTHDIEKAVDTVVSPFKSQPLVFALVVMNLALLAYQFWDSSEVRKQRNEYVNETQKILAKCITLDEIERLGHFK